MALTIYNTVNVERSDEPTDIVISGEGAEILSHGPDNLIYRAASHVYREMDESMPELHICCLNDIPLARGLGSSAAAVVGGLMAANVLCGAPLSQDKLLQLGIEIEGHPDNVAPALLGGCQVVVQDGERWVHNQIPLPVNLRAVLLIPDFDMPTEETRSMLPPQVSREDAVYNLGRVALLVSALITNRLQYVRTATEDRLHQPQRGTLFPAMGAIFDAALSAGALGVVLSGGGSTVLAFTDGDGDAIGRAMSVAAVEKGIGSRTRVVKPCPEGACVVPLP